MLAAPTAQDLVRSLALPSAHAVAQNAGGDHRFISLSIHGRCCLRRYTGNSTTPFPDSPSNSRPECHDGANAFPFDVERAIYLTVLHRLMVSGSDRHASRWHHGFRIPGAEELTLEHAYRAMIGLGEEIADGRTTTDAIEEDLYRHRQELFGEVSIAFFDTTSLYFEGAGGQTLGQFGHSKDYRPHLKQVVLGMVLPGDPARARTSLIVWCLKRPMARKPLMHNYIYFETLEVGFDAPDLDRPDPGLDRALRPMAVTDDAVAPIRQFQVLPLGNEGVGFRNQRLRQHAAGALSGKLGQRIVDGIRLTERDDSAISRHGVSLVWDNFCQRYFSGFLAPMVGSCLRLGADCSSRTRRRLQPTGSWKQNGPRRARHSAQIIAPHTCIR